jgi:uncharacterized protein YdhG (YjbR/CyaY superfamily)
MQSDIETYVASIPAQARPHFDELRTLVRTVASHANEVYSYGIIGYKVDAKRARVYISGWKDHVSIYPIPDDESLRQQLAPYVKGKGTLSFALSEPLPLELLEKTIRALIK